MGARVVLRPGLSLGIGLHQEAAKIRNERVDLLDFGAPPALHGRIERVRALQPTDLDRSAEARGQVDTQAIGPQHSGQCRELLQVGVGQADSACIDVVRHHAVDAHRSAGARVVGITGIEIVGQFVPVPDGFARIAALDCPVQVVPVIQDAALQAGTGGNVEVLEGLLRLDQSQEVKSTVKNADIRVGGDHGDPMAFMRKAAQNVAFGAEAVQFELQARDQRQRLRCADDDTAIAGHL